MSRRRLLFPLTLLLLAPPTESAQERPLLPQTAGWLEARTAHFRIYADASERATRKAAVELERFRESLGRITSGLRLDSQVPTTLLLFRNDKSYTPYRLDADGKPLNVSGYFLGGPFQNYITMNAGAGWESQRVIYHEYFHAVMEATLGDLPLWLNEGLAEYYSTFRTRGGSGVVEVGHPIAEHLHHYRMVSRLHWPDVFRVTPDSPAYNEGTRQGAFYAQSWLAVHYLAATDARAQALGRFLTRLRDGADPDAAMQAALGMDPVALGKAVESYAEQGSNYIFWDLGAARPEADVVVEKAPAAAILFRLGDLLARTGPAAAARQHLEAARAAGWPAADVDNALGLLALRQKQPEVAAARLQAAVDRGSGPVESYVLLASLLMEQAAPRPGKRAGDLESLQQALQEARGLLFTAAARAPENVPALVGMARTYLVEGDTSPGLQALETARRQRPLDLEILALGACLLARGGQVAESWRVVEEGLRPRAPERAREAGECVVEGTMEQLRERLEAGHREAARQLLAEAMDAISDGKLQARLQPLQQVVASGGRIVLADGPDTGSGSQAASRVEAYNAIVHLIQSGKQEEGLAQMEEFLGACDAGEAICQVAAENASRLRQMVAFNKQVEVFNEAVRLANAGRRQPAVELLQKLDSEVTDPDFKRRVQELLAALGGRRSAR